MLPKFLAAYPDVRVVLTVDNRNADLVREDIDVSIRIGPLRDSELIARKLTTMSLWPCASPGYLQARGTPLTVDDLLEHNLIAHAERTGPWQIRTPSGDLRDVETMPARSYRSRRWSRRCSSEVRVLDGYRTFMRATHWLPDRWCVFSQITSSRRWTFTRCIRATGACPRK